VLPLGLAVRAGAVVVVGAMAGHLGVAEHGGLRAYRVQGSAQERREMVAAMDWRTTLALLSRDQGLQLRARRYCLVGLPSPGCAPPRPPCPPSLPPCGNGRQPGCPRASSCSPACGPGVWVRVWVRVWVCRAVLRSKVVVCIANY